LPHAIATVDPAKLPAIFSVLATDPRDQKKAIIRAWGGHDDHMHVRFSCTDADVDCRAAKRKKKKKRRRRR
jgi:murein endopeptidase